MHFKTFFNMGCADFVQPDVSHVGGIGELRKIAAMAETYHIPICPHNPSGPVANAATLQVAACCPNLYLLETMASDVPMRSKIAQETLRMENGHMILPDTPGLGVDIDEIELAKYPYRPHRLRHFTGELTDIRPPNEAQYYRAENAQEDKS
jgi:galactonate dehydratase